MADAADETFEQTGSGAAKIIPKQCSALRKGEFVCIKGRPCKIVEMSTSKTGKHGHAKVHMVAIDIFTNKKYEDICPSTHNMNVPIVSRKDFQLSNVDDGYLHLVNDKGELREDLKCPENDIGKDIMKKCQEMEDNSCNDVVTVTVLSAMDEECVIALKITKD